MYVMRRVVMVLYTLQDKIFARLMFWEKKYAIIKCDLVDLSIFIHIQSYPDHFDFPKYLLHVSLVSCQTKPVAFKNYIYDYVFVLWINLYDLLIEEY